MGVQEADSISKNIHHKNGQLQLTIPLAGFPKSDPRPQITKEIICLKRVKERSRWLLAERLYELSRMFAERPEEFQKLTGFDTFRQYINAPELDEAGDPTGGIDLAESTVYTYINLWQSYKVDVVLPDEAQDYLEELDYNKLKYIRKEITPENWKEKFEEVKKAQRGEVFDKHRKKVVETEGEESQPEAGKKKESERTLKVKPCKHVHNEYVERCNDCGWKTTTSGEDMLKRLLAPYTKGEGFRLVNMYCRGGKE